MEYVGYPDDAEPVTVNEGEPTRVQIALSNAELVTVTGTRQAERMALQRKRSHIVDDLLALVNAIEHATETDRTVLKPEVDALPLTDLPEVVQALFARPVVAIHPGRGPERVGVVVGWAVVDDAQAEHIAIQADRPIEVAGDRGDVMHPAQPHAFLIRHGREDIALGCRQL